MSMSFTGMMLAQSTLYRAVRAAMQSANVALEDWGVRLSEWPAERPGCLYALSLTLEDSETGQEYGECRFTLDWRGQTYFDADDAPLAPIEPESQPCEEALASFVSRRLVRDNAREAARASRAA